MKFLCYNIHGLIPKLEDSDFVNFVTMYDFVSFTETFLPNELDESVFPKFDKYVSKARKFTKRGRHSGGVVVLVKKCYSKYVKRIDTQIENTVVLRISKELFNTKKDIIYLSMYIPPHDSPFWGKTQNGYAMDLLEKCIMDLYEAMDDFYLMICGDFNARTASKNCNYWSSDDMEPFDVCDNDSVMSRTSQDKEVNVFGQQLLELCNVTECAILNGLTDYGCDSSCTYIGSLGVSVVDLFIMSCDLLICLNVQHLEVLNMVYSDHLPVELAVKISEQQNSEDFTQATEDKDGKEFCMKEKIIWDKEKEGVFKEAWNDSSIRTKLEEAISFTDRDINKALELFIDCLKMASGCMVKKCQMDNKCRRSPWFDIECHRAKKSTKIKLRKFRKTRKDFDRKMFVEEKKQYKRLLKHKKKCYRKELGIGKQKRRFSTILEGNKEDWREGKGWHK